MAEHQTYSYAPRARNAQYQSMDRVLRERILESARRQYEAASRQLRLQAQASSRHGRVSSSSPYSDSKPDVHNSSQAYSSSFAHRPHNGTTVVPSPPSQYKTRHILAPAYSSSRKDAPSSYGSSMVYPYPASARVPMHASTRMRMPVVEARAAPNSQAPTRSPVRAPASASSSTPVTFLIPAGMDGHMSQPEDNLDVVELKRRYYAQLAGAKASSSTKERQTTFRKPTQTASVNNPSNGGRGPVRTMADDYLDFYMPARRGPYPTHDDPRRYRNEPEHGSPRTGEQHEPRQRSISAHSPNPARPEPGAPSKSKADLAFMLNDTAPQSFSPHEDDASSSGRRSPMSNQEGEREGRPKSSNSERQSSDTPNESNPSQPINSGINFQEAPGTVRTLRWRPPMTSNSRVRVTDMQSRISSRYHENEKSLQANSSAKSIRSPELGTGETLPRDSETSSSDRLRTTYDRPLKRKASTPPQSPVCSETPSEECVIESAPLAKRRAFNRLPIDYDSESESETEEENRPKEDAEQSTEPIETDTLPSGEDARS